MFGDDGEGDDLSFLQNNKGGEGMIFGIKSAICEGVR